MKNDPVRLAATREYHRIYMYGKRRELGKKFEPHKGPPVRLILNEHGEAVRKYYKPGENGRLVLVSTNVVKSTRRGDRAA